jgi:CDP-6-deoxy-D-xylo-4-hexulose-3-dehydrase
LGTKWEGKHLAEYAVASSCSFYAAHEICTFEGGMVSSDERGIINIVRSMANWGRDCVCSGVENLLPNGICNHRFSKWLENYDGIIDHKYLFSHMGYNLKPLDVSGAVGVVQLEKLDEICFNRNVSKNAISELFLKYIKGIRIPEQYKQAETVWFGTPIICENKELKNRLVSYLEKNLIQTRHYFAGNILLHPGYKHLGDYKEYPLANKVLDTIFFVGASPSYREYTFEYIEDVLKGFDQ